MTTRKEPYENLRVISEHAERLLWRCEARRLSLSDAERDELAKIVGEFDDYADSIRDRAAKAGFVI